MASFIAYYRVSTSKQHKSGLGLQAQRQAVQDHFNGQMPIAEYTEIESWRRGERSQLNAALAACRVHEAHLVIAKLDRLSRNVAFISHLMDVGVEFIAVDFPYANRLTIHILAAMAEHEAEMISQRTRAALRAAKARGIALGGFRGRAGSREDCRSALKARQLKAKIRRADPLPVLSAIQWQGIGL